MCCSGTDDRDSMPIRLFHITSLDRAISIIRSGRYRPAYPSPLSRDSGLNAGLVGQGLAPQQFEAVGAKLLLEFQGSIKPKAEYPLTVGYVYDELPWRVVVPHGTKAGLTVVGLELFSDTRWHDALPEPPWWAMGNFLKESWRNRAAVELESEILRLLTEHPPLVVG